MKKINKQRKRIKEERRERKIYEKTNGYRRRKREINRKKYEKEKEK